MNEVNAVNMTVGNQNQINKTVNFAKAFGSTPTVVCSLSDIGPNSKTAYINCMAYSVSSTGFTAIIKKKDDAPAYTRDFDVTINWFASDEG